MRPSGNTLILLTALSAFAAAATFYPELFPLWKMAGALLAGVLLLDLVLGRRSPNIEMKRTVKHSLPVGIWSKVFIEYKNLESRTLKLKCYDHHPEECEISALPLFSTLPPGKRVKTHYIIRPRKKGDMVFENLDLLILSPLSLWWKKAVIPSKEPVKVFPNFREIQKFTLLATENRLSTIGIIKQQKRGEGNDFESLRDYRPGDTFRQIDWNKTSRYLKPITKEYQDERDQQVLFLLDCGRRMRHIDSEQTHFDQVLNAMLLLAYVAVRQQDAVGFMTFGGVAKWFPPQKNANTIKRILNQVYTIEPTTEAADYLSAAKNIALLQKRRSLIIIMTNTRDEDHDDLRSAMTILRKKHLVVLADLREKILDTTLTQPVSDLRSAVLFNSVTAYAELRKKNHNALKHQGVLTLDVLAENLPSHLVNEYLMIKASGRL